MARSNFNNKNSKKTTRPGLPRTGSMRDQEQDAKKINKNNLNDDSQSKPNPNPASSEAAAISIASTLSTLETKRETFNFMKKKSKNKLPPLPRLKSQNRASSLEVHLGIDIKFDQLYTLVKTLRSGSYGSVWVCKHVLSNDEFAVKVIDRTKLKPKDDKAVFREVGILRELSTVGKSHRNIVSIIDFFELPNTFHVILELARGGDVFDRLSQRTVYTEADARGLAKNLFEAISFIHSHGIVHRDLKPENLLLVDSQDDVNGLKVADFGFAKKISDAPTSDGLVTRCGTPAFVAPEICIGIPYGKKVDIWSCGVITYMLLGGYPPFQSEDHKGLFRKIRAADYVFHEKYWEDISISAKQLITSCLTVDPFVRSNAEQVMNSTWMNIRNKTFSNFFNQDGSSSLSSVSLNGSLQNMKKINARRKFKSAIHAANYVTSASFWNSKAISFMSKQTIATCSTMTHDDSNTDVDTHQGSNTSISDVHQRTLSSSISRLSSFFSSSNKCKLELENGKVGKTFADIYNLQKKLRHGAHACVWRGSKKGTHGKTSYAIKVVKRTQHTNHDPNNPRSVKMVKDECKKDAQVMNEVAILQSLKHKHVVSLLDFYEEPTQFCLVMELMEGGDVFDRIVERTHYTELDARSLVRSLLHAVEYIHDRGVAHRDLKPQNLLLLTKDNDTFVKVGDFGFAKRVHTPQSLITRCGTPTYVAPEILKNHPHDESADMWSLGVITYVILVGYPPFMEEDQRTLFRKIRNGEYHFFPEDWNDISPQAKEFIKELLVVDPIHRSTAQQSLGHGWISHCEDEELSSNDLSASLQGIKDTLEDMRNSIESDEINSPWSACACLPPLICDDDEVDKKKK